MKTKDNELWTSESYDLLRKFFENSFDGIFITDGEGKILLANSSSVEFFMGNGNGAAATSVKELVEKGIYENSTTMLAIQKRKTITGIVKSQNGCEMISISKPLFNDDGEIELVITNSRPLNSISDVVEKYDKSVLKKETHRKKSNDIKIIYGSDVMKELMNTAAAVAGTDGTIMIYGQTGTGKGLLAQYIHENGSRSEGPFVELNCAAIPENLIESELFGYERGAFTGANITGKIGLFEAADRGTLFLDEIGETPLALQAKLLKVLDDGYVLPVGGTVSRKVNVRLIVATNRDLKKLIREGQFREDLYYRLNILPINIPPLKERGDDIILLSENEIKRLNYKYNKNKRLSERTKKIFASYDWPGNIRQLKNILERSHVLSKGDEIEIELDELYKDGHDLYLENEQYQSNNEYIFEGDRNLKSFIEKAERQHILSVLDKCKGDVNKAASELGIHRATLYKKIRENDAD